MGVDNNNNKRKQSGGSNGFKSLGLSDVVYKGIERMGFRVSFHRH
jgi:hypothetical protein